MLQAVASEPVTENAIPLHDFDELSSLEARLFNDMARSICPRMYLSRLKSSHYIQVYMKKIF